MTFLVDENLDKPDWFIMGCFLIRILDVTIDLNNDKIRIKNLKILQETC